MKTKNIRELKIAIIGMGYVGLPLSVEFGKKFNTVGYDINKERIEDLGRYFDNTNEVTSENIKSSKKLSFSSDSSILKGTDIFIVTVPTPIDDVNRPVLEPLRKASECIGEYLKKDSVVVYESTVYPGCTEEFCAPILEKVSGLRFNEDFYCGYSPERIVPGDKINTIEKIVKITSGSSKESADLIDEIYNEVISAGTYHVSSIKVAEAAKVIENSQRDLNIAFVNELSIIFEKLDIDTSEVLKAAGTKWNFLEFKPGIVGGHCIGVDPYYLTHKAEEVGYHPEVILAGRKINDSMAAHAAQSLIRLMIGNGFSIKNSTVCILGITFKENCPDIRNSKVLDIIEELKRWNVNLVISDPWANPEEVKTKYGITLVDISKIEKVDSIMVAVGHSKFREMKPKDLLNICNNKNPVIADIKAIFDKNELQKCGFKVYRF